MEGFPSLAGGGCPPLADLLLALAAEFRPVDAGASDARLDELALPLFAAAAAGLHVHVLSTNRGWYAGLADGERLWLVDTTMDGSTPDPWSPRPHCAHEVAFALLLGLSERFERVGDATSAARATLLRTHLPLFRRH